MRHVLATLFLVVILAATTARQAPAQSDADAADAAAQAVFLSELEARGAFSNLYELMHSDAQGVIPESAVVGWYEHEFFPLGPRIITVTDVQFADWMWDVTGKTYPAAAAVSYTQPLADGTVTEDVLRLVLEPGTWRWFFGRSREFVDQQIALYPEQEQPSPVPTIPGGPGMTGSDYSGPTPVVALQTATCTPVELKPGYPGYRGFVTGLYGPGEVACLQELQRLYPWFDREQEDAGNAAAAERLGLAGGPSTWVWENWLAIEDERGLPVTCYVDAYQAMAQGTPFAQAQITPFDARTLVGAIGSSDLMGRTAVATGVDTYALERMFLTDYELRAEAWWATGSQHNNAAQLHSAINEYVAWIYSPDGGAPLTTELLELVKTQGGYAPVPESACPLDQIILAGTTVEAAYYGFIPDQLASAMVSTFKAHVDQWLAERARGSTQPLRQFLDANMTLE